MVANRKENTMNKDRITTGLKSLDDLTGGLQPGSLTLYSGVSQSGMTTLLDTTVVGAAFRERTSTLLADLEGGDRQIRILSSHSGVKLLALQRGSLTGEATAALAAVPDDAPLHHTTTRVMPLLLAEAMETEAKLVAIDGARYVQPGPGRSDDLAEILVSLKGLAQSLGAAVVITAPINRDEAFPGNAPSLNSLSREFGLHCDTVVILRRWGSLNPANEKPESVELIVPKNRYGQRGTTYALGDYTYARFRDVERLADSNAA